MKRFSLISPLSDRLMNHKNVEIEYNFKDDATFCHYKNEERIIRWVDNFKNKREGSLANRRNDAYLCISMLLVDTVTDILNDDTIKVQEMTDPKKAIWVIREKLHHTIQALSNGLVIKGFISPKGVDDFVHIDRLIRGIISFDNCGIPMLENYGIGFSFSPMVCMPAMKVDRIAADDSRTPLLYSWKLLSSGVDEECEDMIWDSPISPKVFMRSGSVGRLVNEAYYTGIQYNGDESKFEGIFISKFNLYEDMGNTGRALFRDIPTDSEYQAFIKSNYQESLNGFKFDPPVARDTNTNMININANTGRLPRSITADGFDIPATAEPHFTEKSLSSNR